MLIELTPGMTENESRAAQNSNNGYLGEQVIISGILSLVYPVGAIYLSVLNVNPGTYLGGTWTAWGAGRVPVGVDPSQAEFNTVQKTGGNKKSPLDFGLLTSSYYGAVNNSGTSLFRFKDDDGNYTNTSFSYGDTETITKNTALAASSDTASVSTLKYEITRNIENLQPYITCYMWLRTA